jgi:hypothetical protein
MKKRGQGMLARRAVISFILSKGMPQNTLKVKV